MKLLFPWQRRMEVEQDCQDARSIRQRLGKVEALEREKVMLERKLASVQVEAGQLRQENATLKQQLHKHVTLKEAAQQVHQWLSDNNHIQYINSIDLTAEGFATNPRSARKVLTILRDKGIVGAHDQQRNASPVLLSDMQQPISWTSPSPPTDHVVDVNKMLKPHQRQCMWLLRELYPKHSYEWLGEYLLEHGVSGRNKNSPISRSSLSILKSKGVNRNKSAPRHHKAYTCPVRESLARRIVPVLLPLLESNDRATFQAWVTAGAVLDDDKPSSGGQHDHS